MQNSQFAGWRNSTQLLRGSAYPGNRRLPSLAHRTSQTQIAQLMQAKGGLLAVDNVLSHASEVAEFIGLIEADQRFACASLPVGAGLLLVTAV